MVEVKCSKCGCKFWVKGYTTPDSFTDPGDVVTELECDGELCKCLQDGEEFEVTGEEHDYDGI